MTTVLSEPQAERLGRRVWERLVGELGPVTQSGFQCSSGQTRLKAET